MLKKTFDFVSLRQGLIAVDNDFPRDFLIMGDVAPQSILQTETIGNQDGLKSTYRKQGD